MCVHAQVSLYMFVKARGQCWFCSLTLHFKVGSLCLAGAHCLAGLDGQSVPGTIFFHLPVLGLQELVSPTFNMGV